jgi:hypothetical protein
MTAQIENMYLTSMTILNVIILLELNRTAARRDTTRLPSFETSKGSPTPQELSASIPAKRLNLDTQSGFDRQERRAFSSRKPAFDKP